jgi:hypothetical protein
MGQAGHSATATLTARDQLYMGFWEPLIEQIKATYPGWTNKSVPPKDSWMDLPSGKSYPWYSVAFTGDKKLRVELYVDNPEPAAQQHLWTQLTASRQQIDEQLARLSWEPLDGKRASRVALYSPFDASVDREENWDTYRTWLVDTLGQLRSVLQPRIDQLTAYQSDAGE